MRTSVVYFCAVAAATIFSACGNPNNMDVDMGGDMEPSADAARAKDGSPSADLTAPPSDMTIQREVVEPSIDVPAGNSILLRAYAQGTQNYTCAMTGADGGMTYAWSFVAPAAELFSDAAYTNKIGKHFAGPTWQLNDGSEVKGMNAVKWTPPNDTIDVPWLLLQAKPGSGMQQFAKASYVQRLHTSLGKTEPADTCDGTTVGAMLMKPYTAIYYFWISP